MKLITITVTTNDGRDDEPVIGDTLRLIADQVESGFAEGFDRNETERYHYTVVYSDTEQETTA